MELNRVYRVTSGGLAEYVTCSTDYRIQFENKHEQNKPEKVSLIHLARNFQILVRIADTAQENEEAPNTAPTNNCKKETINI